ncbi:hypothetical protein ES332_A12G015400v1 [Gossypium tomentosum]|uniref:Uncharacterized protein n=1 Tax=Gossypium tomentosum TaxID=34277 RepID=A0A5D2MSF0_GOSTO|nr:hypothetical protein ES332_A12G015400v1 [Gossypium tomentosum]
MKPCWRMKNDLTLSPIGVYQFHNNKVLANTIMSYTYKATLLRLIGWKSKILCSIC